MTSTYMTLARRLAALGMAAGMLSACNLEQEAKAWVQKNQINGVIYIDSGYSEGGNPAKYANRVWEANKAGLRFEIRTPVCKSACTTVLAADRVCVDSKTVAKFHSAKSGVESLGGVLPVGNHEGNLMLAEWYAIKSPKLARDFMTHAAHRVAIGDWWNVPAAKLRSEYGIATCKS